MRISWDPLGFIIIMRFMMGSIMRFKMGFITGFIMGLTMGILWASMGFNGDLMGFNGICVET